MELYDKQCDAAPYLISDGFENVYQGYLIPRRVTKYYNDAYVCITWGPNKVSENVQEATVRLTTAINEAVLSLRGYNHSEIEKWMKGID